MVLVRRHGLKQTKTGNIRLAVNGKIILRLVLVQICMYVSHISPTGPNGNRGN